MHNPQKVSDANEYQRAAQNFLVPNAHRLEYLLLGLASEAGELLEIFAKELRKNGYSYKETADKREEDLCSELGDLLFFVAVIAAKIDLSLSDVMKYNLLKLEVRKVAGTLDSVQKRVEGS